MRRWRPGCHKVDLHLRVTAMIALSVLYSACSDPSTRNTPPTVTEVFQCQNLLIGLSEVSCFEDIAGPGTLRITFKPDPPQGSWELSVSGLAALAERCEFHGSFDETRLSNLQGRGETSIACAIETSIDRAYHELRFETRKASGVESMSISVRYTR